MAAVTFSVQIDWNNDGDYSDAYETQPALNRGVDLRAGADTPRQYSPLRVGEGAWTADNQDKRFSDAAGLIGANLLPNRPMRVQATDGTTTWTLFSGTVEDWLVKVDDYPLVVADFRAVDRLALLANSTISTALYSGQRTDQAVTVVLDAAGFPAGTRSLATGLTTLGYWWVEGQTALEALQDLATHEGSKVYIQGNGTLVFENRYTRQGITTDAATFSSVAKVSYRSRNRDVINRVTVTVKPRTAAGVRTAVWTYSGSVTLAPGEARVFYATASDPFTGALVPVSGTDFTVAAGSVASVSALSKTSGAACSFTITAGGAGATLTGLQMRAYSVPIANTQIWTAEDTASQAAYGLRGLAVDMPYLADPNVGRDAAQYLVGRYAAPVEALDISIIASTANNADATLLQALNRKLGDRVGVSLSYLGIAWSGFIETIKHRIKTSAIETTYSLERARPVDVFTLDDNTYGLLDGVGTLGW